MNSEILLNKIIYKVLNEQTNLKTLIHQIRNEQTVPTGGKDEDDWESEEGDVIDLDMSKKDVDIVDFLDGLEINYMNIDSAQINNIASEDTIATNFANSIQIPLDALEEKQSAWEWFDKHIIDIGTLALGVALYLLATGRIYAKSGLARTLLGKTLLAIEGKIFQILLPPAESKPTLWSEIVSNNLKKVLGNSWFTKRWADVKTQLETQLDDLFASKAISSTTRNEMKAAIRNYDSGIIEANIRSRFVRKFINDYRSGKVSAEEAMEVYKNAEKEILASDKEFKQAFENMKNEIAAHKEARVQAAISDIQVNVGYKTNTKTQAEIQTKIDNLTKAKERINKNPASINADTKNLQQEIDDLQGEVNTILYGDPKGAPAAHTKPYTISNKKKTEVAYKQKQIAEKEKELENIKNKVNDQIDKMIKDEQALLASNKPKTKLKSIQRAKVSSTDVTWLDVKNYTEKYNSDYWRQYVYSQKTWEQFAKDVNTLKNDSRLQYLSKYENWNKFPGFDIWMEDIHKLRDKGVPKEDILRVDRSGNISPDIKTQYRCQRYFWETKRQ